MGEQGVA